MEPRGLSGENIWVQYRWQAMAVQIRHAEGTWRRMIKEVLALALAA